MELKHGREIEPPSAKADAKRSRLKYFAGAAVLFTGLVIAGGRDTKISSATVTKEPTASIATASKPAGTCDSVFANGAEFKIEGVLKKAVHSHADELLAKAKRSSIIINFSVGVDDQGKVRIEDAWTTPESDLSMRDIADITRPMLNAVRLEAPADGNMCSYSMPVVVERKS